MCQVGLLLKIAQYLPEKVSQDFLWIEHRALGAQYNYKHCTVATLGHSDWNKLTCLQFAFAQTNTFG